MSFVVDRLWRGLTASAAETAPDAGDPRLRGRTYAVPFDCVWQAALELAGGGLKHWRLLDADDYDGIIRAEATTPLLRSVGDVTIRVALDSDGQTRVDLRSATRSGRVDLGTNARRIAAFLRALDRSLARVGTRAHAVARTGR